MKLHIVFSLTSLPQIQTFNAEDGAVLKPQQTKWSDALLILRIVKVFLWFFNFETSTMLDFARFMKCVWAFVTGVHSFCDSPFILIENYFRCLAMDRLNMKEVDVLCEFFENMDFWKKK